MQTWLTRVSWRAASQDLESRQAVLQTIEAYDLFEYLLGYSDESKEAPPAPLQRMWQGHEYSLGIYAMTMGERVHKLGIKDEIFFKTHDLFQQWKKDAKEDGEPIPSWVTPPWARDTDVMRSHRSNLVRRWPRQYSPIFLKTPDNMPYVWPLLDGKGGYNLNVSKFDKDLIAKGERVLPKAIAERVVNL